MCAEVYHCAGFIASDPVQFPHRYTLKQDIEISGLLTAIMSFGNRKQILKKAEELHKLMGTSPYQYVLSRRWEEDFPSGATHSFYRMLSYADFHGYFRRLYTAYTQFGTLEDALKVYSGVSAAVQAALLSMRGIKTNNDGIVEEDIERTIRNVGLIGTKGMEETDKTILNIMCNKK